jgi:hypothetical protein
MLLVLVFPAKTWESLMDSKQGTIYHLLFGLLPVLALCGAIEGWAFHTFGTQRGYFGTTIMMDWDSVLKFQTIHLSILSSTVILGALLIRIIGLGAHLNPDLRTCFIVSIYGLSPLIWVKILDGVPFMHTWLCWSMGASGIFYLLYSGIPVCLRPDPTKAFGLFLMGCLLFIGLSGFAHWSTLTLALR